MERKIYLIFADRVDTVCEIKGYIRGTEDEAQAYCLELNKNAGERPEEFVWMELPQLSIYDLWKTTMPAGFTTVPKTAEKWGVTKARVYYLCKEGRIPGAIYANDHWCIPEDAESPAEKKASFASAIEMAAKWDISYDLVLWLCKEGQILGAECVGNKWRIPVNAVCPLEGYVFVSELARKWGMNRVQVSGFCKEGRIPGAKRVGRNWYVPSDAEKPTNIKAKRKSGYISATEMAKKWNVSRQHVCRLCARGEIPDVENIGGVWHIPEDTPKPLNKATERLSGYISVMRAAEKWEVSHAFVLNAVKQGRIPGAECIDGRWHIPENAERPMDRRGKWRKK